MIPDSAPTFPFPAGQHRVQWRVSYVDRGHRMTWSIGRDAERTLEDLAQCASEGTWESPRRERRLVVTWADGATYAGPWTTESVSTIYLVDSANAVSVYADGIKVAAAWGPSANGDNNWFLAIVGQEPQRVASRGEAVALLPKSWPPPEAVE